MGKTATRHVTTTLWIVILSAIACFAVDFQSINLSQNVNTNALDVVNTCLSKMENGTVVVKTDESDITDIDSQRVHGNANGITFDMYEDGEMRIYFEDDGRSPLDKVVINGKTLNDTIHDAVSQTVAQMLNNGQSMIVQYIDDKMDSRVGDVSNAVNAMVYNPLWGKKLAVIGDSLISSPTRETSYPAYIAQRNNMVLVHNGRSGEKLCSDLNNNPACINSYTNDIPVDSDFILCQIGANDDNFDASVPDTDMSLNTFKGCWNNLLLGIKTTYPRAKFGIILSNTWTDNLGQKSEDVATNDWRRAMTQWQKTQCQKLNIPVLDPVDDTRFFVFNLSTTNLDATAYAQYDEWYWNMKQRMGTSSHRYYNGVLTQQSQYMVDYQHTTNKGNLLLAAFYEFWMKTVLSAN